MRILLLNQHYYPDIAATAQLATDWAEWFAERGHPVTVLCGSGKYRIPHKGHLPDANQPLPSIQLHRGVRIVRVSVPDAPVAQPAHASRADKARHLARRAAAYGQFLAKAAAKLTQLDRPDVVVALTTPPFVGALGLCAQRFHRAKLVLWVQDVYPDLLWASGLLSKEAPFTRALAALARRLYQSADALIALDEAMAARLVQAGADPAKLTVIDHVANTQELKPTPRGHSRLKHALGLRDEFVVCYSGNHGRGHDFDTVLSALSEQARTPTEPPIHWLFVGDGDEKARFLAAVPEPLRKNVHALPPQARSELSDVLAAADVGLISVKANMEGLVAPSKLYGLLAAGRPIAYIGPSRGRIPALFREMDLGVCVPPHDGPALLRGLRALQADPARWQTIAETCRRLAQTRFDKRLLLIRHEMLLRSLVQEPT